jgi:hypothetical protein
MILKRKNIYGNASNNDLSGLTEEGVEVIPMLDLEKTDN